MTAIFAEDENAALEATYGSLIQLTEQYVDKPGIAKSLKQKLLNAQKSEDRGNEQAK